MYNRSLLISCLLICVVFYHLTAQVKHDANWVFGNNAGINFLDADTSLIFQSICYNTEQNASISDELGNLIFYISTESLNNPFVIRDAENNIILNGDNIKCDYNVTSGAIIIKQYSINKYLMFHLFPIFNHPDCNTAFCTLLYKTVVSMNSCGDICVETKNELMLNNPLYEKMAIVKHADGNSWWLLLHTESFIQGEYQNTFIRFLISDTTISGPFYQNIGIARNRIGDFSGQMKISKDGSKLALIRHDSRFLELYDIDRCSGNISNFKHRNINLLNGFYTYGLEFSPYANFLYISAYKTLNQKESILYQIPTDSLFFLSSTEIYSDTGLLLQLQVASDNNIYIAGMKGLSFNSPPDDYNQNLSVIHQPDSAGLTCDFRPFSFFLGDSSTSTEGLPNFPNYNLGALSIYEAEAGRDTIICTDSTISQKVVQLGSPKINGVQYQWYPNYNLSSDTAAQPLAFPDTSTMYYVMLSDTSIKNACKTRLDSVLVEVKNCVTGINDPQTPKGGLRVYPNPASQEINIQIQNTKLKIKEVKVYDVAGRIVHSQLPIAIGTVVHSNITKINLNDLEMGLYFIEVTLSNGSVERVKFIKQ